MKGDELGPISERPTLLNADLDATETEVLVLAAGCFWGVEKKLRDEFKDGVRSTWCGYTGDDSLKTATYNSLGTCAEAVRVEYHPDHVTPKHLLSFFFALHDPTELQQRDTQYRSHVFTTTKAQVDAYMEARETAEEKFAPATVQTRQGELRQFFAAEEQHQNKLRGGGV
eukprot:Polyplicarium_translucidae@DN964_c0_g1_i1.p1